MCDWHIFHFYPNPRLFLLVMTTKEHSGELTVILQNIKNSNLRWVNSSLPRRCNGPFNFMSTASPCWRGQAKSAPHPRKKRSKCWHDAPLRNGIFLLNSSEPKPSFSLTCTPSEIFEDQRMPWELPLWKWHLKPLQKISSTEGGMDIKWNGPILRWIVMSSKQHQTVYHD